MVVSNETGRWRFFTYEELIPRDKAIVDIFWLRDESPEASANLPDVRAAEIAEDLRPALEQFSSFSAELGSQHGVEDHETVT